MAKCGPSVKVWEKKPLSSAVINVRFLALAGLLKCRLLLVIVDLGYDCEIPRPPLFNVFVEGC
jgi:hypothetical protein